MLRAKTQVLKTMVSKADTTTVFASDERFPLLREICGILLGLLALLILLALISFHQQNNWIGQRGASAASLMVLVFGNYVAYVFPGLLGISAVLVLWRTPTGMGRGWLRGIGGVLILTATCALLTLPSFTATGFDKVRALQMGGIIGNFLVHPSGLNLAKQLGIVGAAVVFVGAAWPARRRRLARLNSRGCSAFLHGCRRCASLRG
jgi:hypothetical protein